MVDLEAVLKKEGSFTAKRLLEQYIENFVEPKDLRDDVQKAEETIKRLAKDGLGILIPLLNEAFSTDFYDDDFKNAYIVETPERIKHFETQYGVICPTVSISFPKDRWGNGIKNRVKAFFKGYKTIIQKFGYHQDPLGLVKYYGFYISNEKFRPNHKLFLDCTGLSFLEDSPYVDGHWTHESLHAAYKKHSKISPHTISKYAYPYLSKLDKMEVAEAIMDMSLLDELSARRVNQDIDTLISSPQAYYGDTTSFYLGVAAAKYNKYAEENGIEKISNEYLKELTEKKVLQLNRAVYDVHGLGEKVLQSQITRILFTSAPTKQELSMKMCHSPFLDLSHWKQIVEKYC